MSLRLYIGLSAIILNYVQYANGQLNNGGPVVSLENYKFQSIIHIIIDGKVVHMCGGAIVSPYHVLTTASCFARAPNEFYEIKVRVGSVNMLDGGNVYNVSKIERHPQYDSYISTHNLAIAFISDRIHYEEGTIIQTGKGDYIKSVGEIPLSNSFISGGDKVVISGYSLKAVFEANNQLFDIYTYSMSYFPCLDYFRDSVMSVELIDDEILCIQNNPGSGYCDIMDGAALVEDQKLVGMFLYSDGKCDNIKMPMLFTRITNNLLWINSHINPSKFDNTRRCPAN